MGINVEVKKEPGPTAVEVGTLKTGDLFACSPSPYEIWMVVPIRDTAWAEKTNCVGCCLPGSGIISYVRSDSKVYKFQATNVLKVEIVKG